MLQPIVVRRRPERLRADRGGAAPAGGEEGRPRHDPGRGPRLRGRGHPPRGDHREHPPRGPRPDRARGGLPGAPGRPRVSSRRRSRSASVCRGHTSRTRSGCCSSPPTCSSSWPTARSRRVTPGRCWGFPMPGGAGHPRAASGRRGTCRSARSRSSCASSWTARRRRSSGGPRPPRRRRSRPATPAWSRSRRSCPSSSPRGSRSSSRKKRGRVVIEFGSADDLERIVSEIIGSGPGLAPD